MRRVVSYAAVIAAVCLSACASRPRIDGIPIYGQVGLISDADIRAAIAEDRKSPSLPENTIYAVDIVSPTEVHVHHRRWDPRIFEYNEIFRVRGKWRRSEDRVVGGASRI
jgi:hypothetical protein